MTDRFSSLIPNDNVYVIAEASDLPQVVDRWRIYHLLYDPGAGAGLYYSPDAINLTRLATGGSTLPAGTTEGSIIRWDSGGGVWVEFTSFILPAADGTLDQIMQTDGAGVVSWIDIPAGVAPGTVVSSTLRWDGADWVENTGVRTLAGLIFGGTVAGSILTLTGSSGSPDKGRVEFDAPIESHYDTFSNTTPAEQYAFTWAPSVAASGNYIGGFLNTAAVFDVTTALFIPAIFSDGNIYNIGLAPGFSAITFINELSQVVNDGNFNLPSALVMNVGLTHHRETAGTSTTAGTTGMNFSPSTRASISGAVMTKTDQTAVRLSPVYSTVAGSTANLGTIRGLHCFNPAVGIFQPGAGTETMTAYYGVDVNNITFGGTAEVAAIRSAIVAGTNQYFMLNNGGAISDLSGGHIYWDDNGGVVFGGTGVSTFDAWISWNAADYLRFYFHTVVGNGDSLRWTNPDPDRFLFDSDGGIDTEYNFNCGKCTIGAQTGSIGNGWFQLIAPARTTSINGDWADILLTQAGNLTVANTMGTIATQVFNAVSITGGGGSAVTNACVQIGGNPSFATTNRVGLHIISNPSGASNINAALWVENGESVFGAGCRVEAAGTFIFEERAASSPPGAGEGEFWVRDDSPTVPIFTDSAGTDFVLTEHPEGIQGLGVWRYRTETGTPPASGQIRFDNADVSLATEFYISETTDGGTDVSTFMDLLLIEDAILYMQDRTNADNAVLIEVGTVVDSGTYRTCQIQNSIEQGTEPTQNTQVAIFVAASGAGAGGVLPAGTTTDASLRWNGSSWVENNAVLLTDTGTLGQVIVNGLASSAVTSAPFLAQFSGGDRYIIGATSTDDSDTFGISWNLSSSDANEEVRFEWGTYTGTPLIFRRGDRSIHFDGGTVIAQVGSLFLTELAVANADRSTYGQFWVTNAAQQVPMFTDESGVDFPLVGGGGTLPAGTVADSTLAWSGSAWVERTETRIDLSANVYLVSGSPHLDFRETGATVDEGNWIVQANVDEFYIATADDAFPTAAVDDVLRATRTGTVVNTLQSGNYIFDVDQAVGVGQDNFALIYDNGTGLISLEAIPAGGGQVDSVVGGTNISVNAADPVNPIVNLDAAITGVSVNGVTLTAAGAATNYLDETGAYSVPPDTGITQLTGDVTAGPGSGSQAATIPNDTVDNARLANMANNTIKARGGGAGDPQDWLVGTNEILGNQGGALVSAQVNTAQILNLAVTYGKMQNVVANDVLLGNDDGAGNFPQELTGADVNLFLPIFTSTLNGLAPLSGGGSTNYLRADGTWAAPPGTGGTPAGADEQVQWNDAGAFGADGSLTWNGTRLLIGDAGVGGQLLDLRDGNTTGAGAVASIVFSDQVGTVYGSVGLTIITSTVFLSAPIGGMLISAAQGLNISCGAANEVRFTTGSVVRHYESTDTHYLEIDPVSTTEFRIGVSNASAGMYFDNANFYRFDDEVQAESGLTIDGAIASSLQMEVAGLNRCGWTCFPTSLTLSLAQTSGHIYTIQRGINDIWSIQETGGMTIYENGAADTDFINIFHDGTDAVIDSSGASDLQITGGVRLQVFQTGDVNSVNLSCVGAVGRITTSSGVELRFQQGGVDLGGGQLSATGVTSLMYVRDHASIDHDIGFNDLRIFNDNVSDTLEAGHAGQIAFKDAATARTLTLAASGDLDFPVETLTTVLNAFTSGDYTVTEGAGTTLYVLDGTTRVDSAGGITIGPGGVVNIWRESATVYYCWGSGITP